MVFIVVVLFTGIGLEYTGELAVGVAPLVVKWIVTFGEMSARAIICAEWYMPAEGLKVGVAATSVYVPVATALGENAPPPATAFIVVVVLTAIGLV
jgi:pyruvate/2-oxoacid:ferredoxin oxidoreductase alpha subunit